MHWSPSQNEKYSLKSYHLLWLKCLVNTKIQWDFNPAVEKKIFNTFYLKCLIKKPFYFQSTTPSCTDLILTNKKQFFKNSVLEVMISDHHSLVVTA